MIAYDRLSQIIPADQALANKALQIGLQQLTGVSQTELPALGETISNLETTKDLPLVTALTTAVPSSVANYYTNNLAIGSGPNNNVMVTDMLGTLIGWNETDVLTQTVELFEQINLSYLLTCYQTMANVIAGVYTQQIDPGPPPVYEVVIPSGTPGAGTYANEDSALTSGVIPATYVEVGNIISAYPTQVSTLNTGWTQMATQVINEPILQARAKLIFANLTPNDQSSIYGLIYSLPEYGQDIKQGGKAQFIEGVADINTFTGQCIVASLREGRNQQALGLSGITTNSGIPAEADPPGPDAVLIPSEYTETEAKNLVIK
jgi:hypothetical protein